MLNLLNTWQFNLLGFIVCNIIFNQSYKLAVKKVKKDGAATVILQGFAGASALLFVPFFPIKFPSDWKIYGLLVFACIFFAISDRTQTTVRKNLEVSVYAILNQLSSVFLILYGLTIFHESFVLTKMVGAGLILVANIFLRYSGRKFNVNKYVLLAAFANLIFATALTIDIGISKHFNLPIYNMFTLLIPAFIIKTAEKTTIGEIQAEYENGNKKYYILTGISWALLLIFMIRAFQFGGFTLITPLSATAVLLNVLIGTLFLRERKDILKKIIAALIVIFGVYLTVLK